MASVTLVNTIYTFLKGGKEDMEKKPGSMDGEKGPANNLEEIIGKARVRGERLRRRQKQEKELKRRQGKATSKKEAG